MPGELLSVLAPTFVCAALGWSWGRWGPGYDIALITALIALPLGLMVAWLLVAIVNVEADSVARESANLGRVVEPCIHRRR